MRVLPATIFSNYKVYPGRRNYYELLLPDTGWQPTYTPELPDGFHICAVDPALMVQTGQRGYDALVEELKSECESVEEFMQWSFGSVITSTDAFVGWCLSEYNLGERCEIGIATDEGYRRQGLATLCAIAMLRQAMERGIRRIGWHCWLRNVGSNATARKLGFQLHNEHGAFFVPASFWLK